MLKLFFSQNNYYLVDIKPDRMAKDLPVGTRVFCIDEHLTGFPEVRISSETDHCFGCQPLIASTEEIEGCLLMYYDMIEEALKGFNLNALAVDYTEEKYLPEAYSSSDIWQLINSAFLDGFKYRSANNLHDGWEVEAEFDLENNEVKNLKIK